MEIRSGWRSAGRDSRRRKTDCRMPAECVRGEWSCLRRGFRFAEAGRLLHAHRESNWALFGTGTIDALVFVAADVRRRSSVAIKKTAFLRRRLRSNLHLLQLFQPEFHR